MKTTILFASTALLAAGLLLAPPAAKAAVQGGTGEIQIYAGWNWPDVSGTNIDDLTYGIRGGYNVNPHFGIEGDVGYFDTSVPAVGKNPDLNAWFLDLSFAWQVNPDDRAVFLLYGGPGWTEWNLNNPAPGKDENDSSVTGHVGVAGKFYATDRVFIRVDGKVRWFDLNDVTNESVTDYEGTVSVGWTIGK